MHAVEPGDFPDRLERGVPVDLAADRGRHRVRPEGDKPLRALLRGDPRGGGAEEEQEEKARNLHVSKIGAGTLTKTRP